MKDSEIQELAKIFDSIITSPSQAVHDAFRNLTVLATLSKGDNPEAGPFESIMSRIVSLEHDVQTIRREVQIHNNSAESRDGQWLYDSKSLTGSVGSVIISGGPGIDTITISPAYDSNFDTMSVGDITFDLKE